MITQHAATRITHRLNGLISKNDIKHMSKIADGLNARKHYIRIKQLGKVMHFPGSTGDCVTVIIENNNVVTAMLSRNSQRWNDGTFKVLLTQ